MIAYLTAYLATIVCVVIIDYAWLSTMGLRLYRARLGNLLLDQPILWAAGLFYILYALGVTVLAIAPAIRAQSWIEAAVLGGFVGLTAYMTYDLTNLATMRQWSLLITALDIVWGTLLTAISATVGYFVARIAS